jgi:hypothetical protein
MQRTENTRSDGTRLSERLTRGAPLAVILLSFPALALLLGPVVGAILAVPTTVPISAPIEELTEKHPSLGDGAKEKSNPSGKPDKDA